MYPVWAFKFWLKIYKLSIKGDARIAKLTIIYDAVNTDNTCLL